jgi:hypothetical protein
MIDRRPQSDTLCWRSRLKAHCNGMFVIRFLARISIHAGDVRRLKSTRRLHQPHSRSLDNRNANRFSVSRGSLKAGF